MSFVVTKISQLVEILSATKICEGNSDEQFTSLPNIHMSVLKNQCSKQTYETVLILLQGLILLPSLNLPVLEFVCLPYCEVLIESTTSPLRCTTCKKHRQSLSITSSHAQKDEWTHPNSHTNYSYLTTPKKNECLHQLHADNKTAKLQITCLENRILNLLIKMEKF